MGLFIYIYLINRILLNKNKYKMLYNIVSMKIKWMEVLRMGIFNTIFFYTTIMVVAFLLFTTDAGKVLTTAIATSIVNETVDDTNTTD